jgi:polyisoprenoid-binding protein YceI
MTMQTLQKTAAPTRWTVDPAQSTVEFAAKSFWGLLTVRGRFDRFDGTYEAGLDGITIELTVDGDSLDTGNAKRDDHLRSADFFGIADNPNVRFTSTRINYVGEGVLHVQGELEAAGAVVPVELDATLREIGGGLEVEATTTVDHARFGMSSGLLGMIRTPVVLHVKARLTQ